MNKRKLILRKPLHIFQAKDGFDMLRRFIKFSANVKNNHFSTTFEIEKLVEEKFQNENRQVEV